MGHKTKKTCLNFVLLGKTGSGKSAAGNTILGKNTFKSIKSPTSVTQDVQKECNTVYGFPVAVYDTPGFCDTELSDEQIRQKCQKLLNSCDFESEFCSYLLVIKADRFTAEDKTTVEKIEDLLGEDRLQKTWILFTRGDELEDDKQTIETFISRTDALKKLVQKYGNRYHVFNNKIKNSCEQVRGLIVKVFKKYLKSGAHLIRRKQKTTEHRSTRSARRIVLLGKTGVGKSATGNTILGNKCFTSKHSSNSVTSKSEAHSGRINDRDVTVIDTPGLFDTSILTEELVTEIGRSIYLSSPGPHAFLLVLKITDKFTVQEQELIQKIEMLFGDEVAKYMIVLFTCGDQLDDENETTVEDFINENGSLRNLVERSGGGYHVFNNKDKRNREQVSELLEKIDRMVEKNEGGCYTNEMFEEAARLKKEEQDKFIQEEEEQKQRIKKQNLEEIDKVVRQTEIRITKEKQKEITQLKSQVEKANQKDLNNEKAQNTTDEPEHGFLKFMKTFGPYILIGGFCGLVIGGVCAVIGLGVGAVTGLSVGAVTGLAVGAVVGAVVNANKYKKREKKE